MQQNTCTLAIYSGIFYSCELQQHILQFRITVAYFTVVKYCDIITVVNYSGVTVNLTGIFYNCELLWHIFTVLDSCGFFAKMDSEGRSSLASVSLSIFNAEMEALAKWNNLVLKSLNWKKLLLSFEANVWYFCLFHSTYRKVLKRHLYCRSSCFNLNISVPMCKAIKNLHKVNRLKLLRKFPLGRFAINCRNWCFPWGIAVLTK